MVLASFKVGRNGNNRIVDSITEVSVSSLLRFQEDHGGKGSETMPIMESYYIRIPCPCCDKKRHMRNSVEL